MINPLSNQNYYNPYNTVQGHTAGQQRTHGTAAVRWRTGSCRRYA